MGKKREFGGDYYCCRDTSMLDFYSEIQLSFGKVVHNRGEFRFELTEFHRLLFAFCLIRSFVLSWNFISLKIGILLFKNYRISKRCENIIAFSDKSYKSIRKLSM